MRVVEKLLKCLANFSIAQALQVDEKWTESWQNKIQEWKHLQSFKIFQPTETKASKRFKYKTSSLSGDQASSILENGEKIDLKLERTMRDWSEACDNLNPKRTDLKLQISQFMKHCKIVDNLSLLFKTLESWNITDNDIAYSKEMGEYVLNDWESLFGEENVTPYLHIVCKHGHEHLKRFRHLGGLSAMSQQGK